MRVGHVAVVGKPNVGKSTLVNAIVGMKVSIVSDKAQTTRRKVRGVATKDNCQIVFVDTPGLHEAHTALGKILNEAARTSIEGVDLVLIVVDCSRMPAKEDKNVSEMLHAAGVFKEGGPRSVLCLNKMDVLRAEDVQRNWDAYQELFPAEDVMLTSFSKKQNIEKLEKMIIERLPEGNLLFPEDEYTDQSSRFLVAELVREKALQLTRQEVPHSIGVVVETWDDSNPKQIQIQVVLAIERDGQKAILIGKKGAMLKEIGIAARKDIEEMRGTSVYLELFVKVIPNWRGNMDVLREFDYF